MIRPAADRSAAQRLRTALEQAAEAFDTTLTEADFARCAAVSGDITQPGCGVTASAVDAAHDVTTVWHSAASLAFEADRADEIALHNVEGTRNVLRLAEELGATSFNHISTAYVAGSRRGSILEEPVPETVEPNNEYERTKIVAENLVLRAGFQTTRIFRPTIVIGHSGTRAATTFSGLYGFVRGIQRARDTVREQLGDLLKYRPLRLMANGDTPVNLIPVDVVAATAVAIASKSESSGIYHLANSRPALLSSMWKSAADTLAMKYPIFVDSPDEFTLIDEKVDGHMNFFRSYINDEKYFSVQNVEDILGKGVLAVDMPADEIGKYVEWFVNREAVVR